MGPTVRLLMVAAALVLACPWTAPAQEKAPARKPAAPPTPAPTPAGAVDAPPPRQVLLVLHGGGEVFGRIVKETPATVFVDAGPEILPIAVGSIERRVPLEELEQEAKSGRPRVGAGAGTVDPATGAIVFRGDGAKSSRSQTEILDHAKRSVVLVSNSRGRGSGWVLDKEGRIVTNHHVVGNEKFQTVTLFVPQGTQWERKRFDNCMVEAFSRVYDIAIVRLDTEALAREKVELVPIAVAAPDSLKAGEQVFAVGNPGMGGTILAHTISEGIVSSLARNFDDVIYIQTTAAVNPGNSGGPLLDARGNVVGLITLKATFQEGIAFALPTSLILHFLANSKAFEYSETNRNKGFKYLPPN